MVHSAEVYTSVTGIDSDYTPLSDAIPTLDSTSLGGLNIAFPFKLETSHCPGTRKTIIYCRRDDGIEKHSFNSVWHDNYRREDFDRNPLIKQIGYLTGVSLFMGSLCSLLGTQKVEIIPYLFLLGFFGVAGQYVLPNNRGDRNEMRHDRIAWKKYQEWKKLV